MNTYKLGSLFDGSGGFPLAGFMCNIVPVWAAEIEPYPIAVTRSRFPYMKHLGDISKINGAEIEPVDIITFGSPCQDLSVAGKRAGLKHTENGDEETTRSGLFMEAVRIIKEMREATNGKYPRFALWENVPGAFSSNKGEDFRVVLEELIKIIEPTATMPAVPKNGWPYADSYCGDRWSIAYRVLDAQYWGVPQRRRRIYLVADFGGQCAGEISFKRDGLRGYFEEGRAPWQGATADAENGVGAADCTRNCIAYSFDSLASNSMKSNNPHSGCRQVEVSKTLDCFDPNPSKNQGGIAILEPVSESGEPLAYGWPLGFRPENTRVYEETATTICNGTRPGFTCGVIQAVAKEQHLFENHSQDTRYKGPLEVSPMLPAQLGTGGNNTPFVVESKVYESHPMDSRIKELDGVQAIVLDRAFYNQGINAKYEPQLYTDGICPPLIARGPAAVCVRYVVRRLTPTECARLQGFADRWGDIDPKTDFSDEEYRFWLDIRNTHAEINGKATKEYTKAQMLTWYNKLHTDSSEYKMWGNGIALPTALYMMQGIAEVLVREGA